MKPDPALVRLIETTRHFWGLGVTPFSSDREDRGVEVDYEGESCAICTFSLPQIVSV